MTICLVSLRLICLRYLIEMHSTKVLVCKQACRTLAVQHASYIVPGEGGMHQGGRGQERARVPERRGKPRGENKKIYCFLIFKNSLQNLIKAEEKLTFLPL